MQLKQLQPGEKTDQGADKYDVSPPNTQKDNELFPDEMNVQMLTLTTS